MSASLPVNRVVLTGQVVDEPIVHYLAPGYPEVTLRLMTCEALPTHGGTQVEERKLWHSLVARGAVGIQIEQAVHAGSQLAVAGRLDYHRETDRHGQTKTVTLILVEQIQLLDSGGHSPQAPPVPYSTPPASRFQAERYTPTTEEEDPLC